MSSDYPVAFKKSEEEYRFGCPDLPGCWSQGSTEKEAAIARQFQFKEFPGSIQFVNQVAEAAEAAWHHPDIDVRWNKVYLVLTTHDEGGLTLKDFDLARSFDKIAVEKFPLTETPPS